MKKLRQYAERCMRRFLPRRVYAFIMAFYTCPVNCYTLVFRLGMFRATLTGKSVDQHGNPQPWYTYPAVEYLKGRDLLSKDVFEFGSGYSTAYFSKHTQSVTSVENIPEWRDRVLAMTGDNARIILATTEAGYLAAINQCELYDIIAIDGDGWRLSCAKTAINKLRPGGMIILDNSDVEVATAEYLDTCGLLRVDFWGFCPTVNYYGCTTIYFDTRKSQ